MYFIYLCVLAFLGFVSSLVYFGMKSFGCIWGVEVYLALICDVLLEALRTSIIHVNVEGFSVDTLDSCLWLQANVSSASCALVSLTNPVIYLCLIWVRFVNAVRMQY